MRIYFLSISKKNHFYEFIKKLTHSKFCGLVSHVKLRHADLLSVITIPVGNSVNVDPSPVKNDTELDCFTQYL